MQKSDSCGIAGSVVKVRLHPCLPRLAALGRDSHADLLVIWDISNDHLREIFRLRVVAQEPEGPLLADRRKGRLMDVAFNPRDDSFVLVRHKHQLEVWQLPQGIPQGQPDNAFAGNAVAFSPEGRWLVYSTRPPEPIPGGRRGTRICDLDNGEHFDLDCETDTTFAIHPREPFIAAGWNDQGGGEIRLLTIGSQFRRCTSRFDAPGWVDGLTFAPDGESLTVLGGAGFDGYFTLQVYDFDAESGSCKHKRFEQSWQKAPTEESGWDLPWADQVVFSSDSSKLVCPDATGGLLELDARTGLQTNRWEEHERMVTSIDVAHERGVLAAGSRDGRVVLWRVAGI